MNLPQAMISLLLRRTLSVATAACAILATSCNTFPPPAPQAGPPFAPDGRPRYGHNGTESPNYPNDPRSVPGSSGQPDIKRDPNNTKVDITPPAPRSGTDTATSPPPVNPDASLPPVTADPPPVKKPVPPEDLPFGTPVVGKQGMVYSPYAPEKGQVDVEGLKRGTRVECPYTKKHFRVP